MILQISNKKNLATILLSGFLLVNLTPLVLANPLGVCAEYYTLGVLTDKGGCGANSSCIVLPAAIGWGEVCVLRTGQYAKDVAAIANVITSITCTTGQPLYNPNGDPVGCIVPIKQTAKDTHGKVIQYICESGSQAYYRLDTGWAAVLTGGLISSSGEFLGCIAPPATVTRAGDVDAGKVTGTIRPYEMQVPIPCQPLFGGGCPNIETGPTLANYVARLYQFGLMIVGLFAFGGIIYGALKYILSAGSMADQSDARDQITQAVVGLLILLGAYTLLYTINPRLVSLRDPEIVPLNVADLKEPEDAGQKSQIPKAGAGSIDPLCKLSVNAGIDVRFNSSLGQVGGDQRTGNTCVSCQANASKVSGTCKCNAGYTQVEGDAYDECRVAPPSRPLEPLLL